MVDSRLNREQAAQLRQIVAEAKAAALRVVQEEKARIVQQVVDTAVEPLKAKYATLETRMQEQWQKLLDVEEIASEAYDKFPRNTWTRNLAEEGHLHPKQQGGGADCVRPDC